MKKNPFVNNRGRGSESNDRGRFERTQLQNDFSDYGWCDLDEEERLLKTQILSDVSKTIINTNDSPDIPFTYSLNPYRGCEHGCSYCYARPTHEYLGHSAGLDFESKIYVKFRAAELLREKLMSRSWEPDSIFMSGVTDCYQPIERKLEITRSCLRVLGEFLNPISLITKNALVVRDIDLLSELARHNAVRITLSITTLDAELGRAMEPRTSSPSARLRAIEALAKAGIPVGVNVAPLIPGLTDHEMPAILKAASEAGAQHAGFVPLRLPYSVKTIFSDWLARHRPERKEKVLSAVRDIRGGDLNNSKFGERMRGQGARADQLRSTFDVFCRKFGLNLKKSKLSTSHFRRPPQPGDQMSFTNI